MTNPSRCAKTPAWPPSGTGTWLLLLLWLAGTAPALAEDAAGEIAPASSYSLVPNTGHSSLVTTLAISPDGALLASAGLDRSLRLWSMEGRLLRVLQGHTGNVTTVAFHPDGELLASIGADATLRLWALDGTEIWSRATDINGQEWAADALAFARDSLWYSAGGWATPVTLEGTAGRPVLIKGDTPRPAAAVLDAAGVPWFATTRGAFAPTLNRNLPELPAAFAGDLTHLAMAADGQLALAGSSSGCVASLALDDDATDGRKDAWTLLAPCQLETSVYPLPATRIAAVVLLPVTTEPTADADADADADTRFQPLALRANGEILTWASPGAETEQQQLTLPELQTAIAATGQGGLILSAGGEILALTTDLRVRHFGGARAHYSSVDFAPKDLGFALGTDTGRVEIWRRDGSLLLAIDAHQAPVLNVLWHANGFLVSRTASEIALWRPDGKLLGRRNMLSAGPGALRWQQEAPATLWASGGISVGYALVGGGLQPGETTSELGDNINALHLPGDGSTLGLGSTGDLLVRQADQSTIRLSLPTEQRIPEPAAAVKAASPLPTGGWVSLDAAGRLVSWQPDGSVAWTRATYQASSFTAGRFTENQLQRWCHAREGWYPDRQQQRIRACILEPELRASLRELPPAGTFDTPAWQQALHGWQHLFWAPTDPLRVAPDGERLATGSWDGSIRLWSSSGESLAGHNLHQGQVRALDWSANGRWLLSVDGQASAVLLDSQTGKTLQLTSNGTDWVTWAADGRFSASRGGAALVSVVGQRAAHAVDQFAPALNDPAAVLEPLGLIGPEQADHYRAARERRYQRLGDNAGINPDGLPRVAIIKVRKEGHRALVHARISAGAQPVARWQLWADDVPLLGINGSDLNGKEPSQEVSAWVDLLNGNNRIEISATDNNGAESIRAVTLVLHERQEQPALWFVGFGISDYQTSWLSKLGYAAKDAQDLAAAMAAMASGFSAVHTRTWLDDAVTPDALVEAHSFLADARPEDIVVLFIAGHGVYDDSDQATFHYLLPQSDPDDLDSTAISFTTAEAVLHGLVARRKLFLMDTCQSGELDSNQDLARYDAAVAAGILPRVPAPAPDQTSAATSTDPNTNTAPRTWLRQRDRFIYADLARRSGAIVFSSAMGHELSNEAAYLRNGFFTQGVLNALSQPGHDRDGNGSLSVPELFDAVRQFVQSESTLDEDEGPTQNPVIDRDNLSADFQLPVLPDHQRDQFSQEN